MTTCRISHTTHIYKSGWNTCWSSSSPCLSLLKFFRSSSLLVSARPGCSLSFSCESKKITLLELIHTNLQFWTRIRCSAKKRDGRFLVKQRLCSSLIRKRLTSLIRQSKMKRSVGENVRGESSLIHISLSSISLHLSSLSIFSLFTRWYHDRLCPMISSSLHPWRFPWFLLSLLLFITYKSPCRFE